MSVQSGWVALEEASSAFERPSWAIRALVDQGKLERKVERGQVYVRAPAPDNSEARGKARDGSMLPASLPEPEEPASETDAPSLDALATELAATLELAIAPTPELAATLELAIAPAPELRTAIATTPATIAPGTFATLAAAADAALWSEVAANLAELAHAARARDSLLARTAQALRAVEAATARAAREPTPAAPPPAPARSPWALASVLLVLIAATCVFARLESAEATGARCEADLALRRATHLEARARLEQARTAALALTLVTTPLAPVTSSSGTLPAGFVR